MKLAFINRKLVNIGILFVLLFTVILMTACDKRSLDPNAIQLTKLTCNKTELYEDNGASWATLKATVKDNNGFPVYEQNINFKSDNPNISFLPARTLTDSSGIATSDVFVSGDILDGADSLTVTVYAYLGTKTYLSKELLVRKNPHAERIIMQGVNNMTLDVNYDMTISAIAYDSNNQIMPNGTVVTFQTNGGYFIDANEVISETEIAARVTNGTASVRYNTSTTAGSFTVSARIGQIYAENPKNITVRAGIPKLIVCSPIDPETEEVIDNVIVNSPPIKIVGRLTDEWSNPITGRIVTLESNLGVIPPSVTTKEDGVFSANFTPGTAAGIALIQAACDSAKTATMLNINTEGVQSLRFTTQGTINLSVQGSGGTESATLGVKLYDNIGNVVNQAGYNIKFSFESKPEGVKINGGETTIVQTDMSGLATVFITSGTKSGIAVLRAELVDADGNPYYPETPIVVRQGQIIIQAGKPNTVAFTIGGHDSGIDLGAGNWKVVIGAIIKDQWGNPVEKNTGVYFSLTDQTTQTYGDSVSVFASSYVGNISAIGDSADGTAYSTLVYHGTLSNMSIGIMASVGSYDGVPFEFDGRIVLPMQNATIEVIPQEQHLDFYPVGGADGSSVKTVLFTTVRDGQNNPVRNVPLIFNTNRGIFNDGDITYSQPSHPFWDPSGAQFNDIPEDEDQFPHTGTTGYNGKNDKWIAFYKYEALPSPMTPIPQDTSADIIVYILGYNTQATTSVILRRFD
ncbi:MAG: Ig-like domain-containing protein [Candidatus Cloacimonadales bacterium]